MDISKLTATQISVLADQYVKDILPPDEYPEVFDDTKIEFIRIINWLKLLNNEKVKTKRVSVYEIYRQNKNAKVKDLIECPICHTKFNKKQYSQAFCCQKCKDAFHNMRNYGKYNTYMIDKYSDFDSDDGMTDHDWDEAFGVAEYND